MTQFALAFASFLLLHSVPAIPGIRTRLVGTMGMRLYLIVYSAVSLLALGWVFHAALMMDYIPLWDTAPWQAWATMICAPAGIFLVLAGLLSSNPLSISVRQGTEKGAIVLVTRHPVLWGFLLWSLGHLLPNGDLRSLLLFGGFAIFSAAGFLMLEKRARKKLGADWGRLSEGTSLMPFAAALRGRTRLTVDSAMLTAALLTILICIWLLGWGHVALFQTDPLAYLSV